MSTNAPLLSVLQPAGPLARISAEIGWVLIAGAAAVFCIVMLALWAALARRGAPHTSSAATHRAWVFGGGLAFPLLVLGALLVYASARTPALVLPRQAGEPIITVIAHLWWWEVRYHDPVTGLRAVSANEIHLPAGRAVTLGLSSADVIHSLWVPALAGKVDMLPGRVHQLRLQADQPGVFRGQCAEFCGEQHARMALHVVAHAPADYARWLALQFHPAQPPATAQAQQGLRVFLEQRCSACHTVRGLGPASDIGPDLTHLGSRLSLGAGTAAMGREALAQWIVQPQQLKPGVRMPGYPQLDAASLAALVAFLAQLQ